MLIAVDNYTEAIAVLEVVSAEGEKIFMLTKQYICSQKSISME